MREVIVDGEAFYVFQDVCAAEGVKVQFAALRKVDERHKRCVRLDSGRVRKDNFVVLNSAGVAELLKVTRRPAATESKEDVGMDVLVRLEKRQFGGELIETVNARELHGFLEVSTRFNDWVANRINDFGFVENQDFVSLTENLVSGGKRKEYHLTLDMAKELSMVERNEKGKQARQYFIECERVAKRGAASVPFSAQRPEVEAAGIFKTFLDLGRAIGFDNNMAAFSANNSTRAIIKVDVLELMDVTRLIAPAQVADFAPGKLGEQMNPPRSAHYINEMLLNLGYQVKTGVKQCPYEATEKGKSLSRLHDVPRSKAAGASQQLRWYAGILDQADVRWATGLLKGGE